MVFTPTSPVRVFGRKAAVTTRPSASATPKEQVASAEANSTKMSPPPAADVPRSSSPLSNWRPGLPRFMRQSQDRPAAGAPPPQETSRWSRTTTESEASEAAALQEPATDKKAKAALKKKMMREKRRTSKDTTNSSPVDPFYDPVTKKLRPFEDPVKPPPVPTKAAHDGLKVVEDEGDMRDPYVPSRPPPTVTAHDDLDVYYDPVTNNITLTKETMDSPDPPPHTATPPVDLDAYYDPYPPTTVTAHDGLEVLDETASEDSSDAEGVVHRASSVRVSKPRIVQHSNSSGGSIPKLYARHTTPTDEGETVMPKTSRSQEDRELLDLLNVTTAALSAGQSADPEEEEAAAAASPGGPQDALKALEGRDSVHLEVEEDVLTTLPQIPARSSARPRAADDVSDDKIQETILERPDSAGRIEALSTLPTPMGGFGSVRIPQATGDHSRASSSTYVSSLSPPPSADGLRLNPVTEKDKRLSRAISAPVRHSTRRVMIRPADLVINRHGDDNTNTNKQFRESIVSTPYPARHGSIGEMDEIVVTMPVREKSSSPNQTLRRSRFLSLHKANPAGQTDTTVVPAAAPQEIHDEKSLPDKKSSVRRTPTTIAAGPEVPLSTKPLPSAALTTKSDRFPSPVAPEALFWDLRLARHPAARVTVEVEIRDKTTFDDERLFTLVRQAYWGQLLGVSRRFFCGARTLSHASLSNSDDHATAAVGGGVEDVDGADFVRHLTHPRLGRRRKMWLLWLRNHQDQGRRSRVANATSETAATSPVFSFVHSRHDSGGGHESSPTGLSNLWSARPSVTTPRMPFQPYTKSKSSRMSSPTTSSSCGHSRCCGSVGTTGPPTVFLHHTFSLWRIVSALILVCLLALFVALMWILFGLPGRGADQGNGQTLIEGKEYTLTWRRDAQGRVGVGLVMGILVLLLGLVGEAVWVWGSWVLL